jgi:excisionase family DNA binding protein
MARSSRSAIPQLLSSTQAAALLGVSIRTVVRMVERGDLEPAQRFGTGPRAAYAFDFEVVQRAAAERILGQPETDQTLFDVTGGDDV